MITDLLENIDTKLEDIYEFGILVFAFVGQATGGTSPKITTFETKICNSSQKSQTLLVTTRLKSRLPPVDTRETKTTINQQEKKQLTQNVRAERRPTDV